MNGDGIVERDEAAEVFRAKSLALTGLLDRDAHVRAQIADIMIQDRNNDLRIDLPEMIVASGLRSDGLRIPHDRHNIVRLLIALEPSGDGRLTRAETEQIVRQAFATVDTDGNGLIADTEMSDFQKRTTAERKAQDEQQLAAQMTRDCVWPGLPAGATVSAVTAFEGGSLSSVTLAGQDVSTGFVHVTIEEGSGPLYVLVGASRPVIWAFRGAVHRVQSVALASPPRGSGAGVAGIDRDRVVVLPRGDCFARHSREEPSSAADQAMNTMLMAAGAGSVSLHSAYDIHNVDLPRGLISGAPSRPPAMPAGTPETLWSAFIRFSPGGIEDVDTGRVIGAAQAERYDVRPQEAGLIQLTAEGVLSLEGEYPLSFRVLKPMRRFPAGLNGAHGVNYTQPESFPLPAGDIGHSCLFAEGSTRILAGDASCAMKLPKR